MVLKRCQVIVNPSSNGTPKFLTKQTRLTTFGVFFLPPSIHLSQLLSGIYNVVFVIASKLKIDKIQCQFFTDPSYSPKRFCLNS